jgi:hypothetical protein
LQSDLDVLAVSHHVSCSLSSNQDDTVLISCPQILEENRCCQILGQVGLKRLSDNEKFRHWILNLGSLANFVGFVLTLHACFAISEDFDILQRAAFSSADIKEVDNKLDDIALDVGLAAAAFHNPATVGDIVLSFDQFCDLGSDLERYLDVSNCDGCEQASKGLVTTVIIAAITFLPSLTTDVVRMYSNYDVNCQKVFATVVACISLFSSLYL